MCDHEFFWRVFITFLPEFFFSVSYGFYISRARLNVGNRGEEKGNGSVPPVSLPACIWLYKHQPSSPVPRNTAIEFFLFIIYLHVYGCGCAAICGEG
jgi:hypothetical protein